MKTWLLVAALCGSLALAGLLRAGTADDTGAWCVVVRQPGEAVIAPDLPAEADIYCHLHGTGRFRVLFREGAAQRRYTVELPATDWFAFTRHLVAGPVTVRVIPLPDETEPNPKFSGFIATTSPDFKPALADFEHPLYARVKNLAARPASVRVSGSCMDPQRYNFDAGFLTAEGFKLDGVLAGNAVSRPLNWSRLPFRRSVLRFQADPERETRVEIGLYADPAGTRVLKTLRLEGKPAPLCTVIIYPQPDGSLRLVTADELMRDRLAELRQALRGDSRPLPVRARITNAIADSGELLDTWQNEAALTRLVGANGASVSLGRLEPQRRALGFTCGWAQDFIPIAPDWTFDAVAARDYAAGHARLLPHGQRSVLIMCDEPRFIPLPKGPELDRRFAAWLREKKLAPADAGAASWDEVHCIEPTPRLPRLSTLSHAFQCEEQYRYWAGYGRAFRAVEPGVDPAVNFAADVYYFGDTLDLWELYRRPGLEMVWAEDWHGYMPLGMGAIAWYADLMRSQAKYRKLPIGTYPILGYGYSPALDAMRYYERFMRGCTNFNLYPYSPRLNEPSWLDNPQVTLNMARRHRDLAQVEDVLVDGTVLPDRVALLYPNSCKLWDRTAFADVFGLYAALLHAGVAVDILTEQDLVDGLGKGYALLYLAGANIRRDALQAVDAFARAGGTVACTSPALLDPYNEPIAGAEAVVGAKRLEKTVDADPVRFAYEYQGAKPVAGVRFEGQELPVYCQQSRLVPADGAAVLAAFADGTPALVKARRGKGAVYCYAFSPGASYMKADYGDNAGFATGLCRNGAMRRLAALPAAGLPRRVTVSAAMIGSRVVAAKAGAVVGLIDYGIGRQGRETVNLSQATVDFETMPPFPVTVTVACKARPKAVRAIRAGAVKWSYAAGRLTVDLPLRGVDMLRLDGPGLF